MRRPALTAEVTPCMISDRLCTSAALESALLAAEYERSDGDRRCDDVNEADEDWRAGIKSEMKRIKGIGIAKRTDSTAGRILSVRVGLNEDLDETEEMGDSGRL